MPLNQTISGNVNNKIGKYRWTICSLIFFATTINYLDRQVISLLKPTLEKEFNWSESDYSNIVIAFQFAYALGMIGAGRLIDELGLKGRSVGKAIVSDVHGNFIVNSGGGTAAQVRELIATAQAQVLDRYGVKLTPEIEDLGEPEQGR